MIASSSQLLNLSQNLQGLSWHGVLQGPLPQSCVVAEKPKCRQAQITQLESELIFPKKSSIQKYINWRKKPFGFPFLPPCSRSKKTSLPHSSSSLPSWQSCFLSQRLVMPMHSPLETHFHWVESSQGQSVSSSPSGQSWVPSHLRTSGNQQTGLWSLLTKPTWSLFHDCGVLGSSQFPYHAQIQPVEVG